MKTSYHTVFLLNNSLLGGAFSYSFEQVLENIHRVSLEKSQWYLYWVSFTKCQTIYKTKGQCVCLCCF